MPISRSPKFDFYRITVPVIKDWHDDLHLVGFNLVGTFDVATIATGPGEDDLQIGAAHSHLSDRMQTCFAELHLPDLSAPNCPEPEFPRYINGFIIQGRLRLLELGQGPLSPWFDELPPLSFANSASMIRDNHGYLAFHAIDGILRLSGAYPDFTKHIALSEKAVKKLRLVFHLPWTDEADIFKLRVPDGKAPTGFLDPQRPSTFFSWVSKNNTNEPDPQ